MSEIQHYEIFNNLALDTKDSVIYFVQRQNGDVKIGKTVNLDARLRAISYEHGDIKLLGVINGGVTKERIIHWCFSDINVYGEWFKLTPGIKKIISKYCFIPENKKGKKKK